MDKNKIEFKIATINEIDDIIEMRVKFILDLRSSSDSMEVKNIYDETSRYIKENFEKESYIGLFGYVDGEIVCTAGLLLYELPPLIGKSNRQIGHVLNFYTVKEHRKMGYGTEMMNFVKKVAKDRGIKRLFLNATKMGEGLYRKNGFYETEEKALVFDLL